MDEPTVVRFTTTDEKPPEIVFLDVVGFPPSSVSVEIGLNEPGTTYFVVQSASAPPPTAEEVSQPRAVSVSYFVDSKPSFNYLVKSMKSFENLVLRNNQFVYNICDRSSTRRCSTGRRQLRPGVPS
jgi:hypothetical protein